MDERKLLERYLILKEEEAAAAVNLDERKKARLEAERDLVQFMENRQMLRTGSYEGLGSVSLRNFNTYKVADEVKDRLFDYLKENNLEGVIKQSVHHKTLDKICNELIENGQALPEFIQPFTVTTLQVNK